MSNTLNNHLIVQLLISIQSPEKENIDVEGLHTALDSHVLTSDVETHHAFARVFSQYIIDGLEDGSASIDGMSPVKTSCDISYQIEACANVAMLVKETLLPNSSTLVYVKIDTGGIPRGGQDYGYYPVLAITIAINDVAPKMFFVHPGVKEDRISDNTRNYHESTRILSDAIRLGKSANEVDDDIATYLKSLSVPVTNPKANSSTVLVCSNEQFVMGYLKANFPAITNLVSPRVMDVDKLLTATEALVPSILTPRFNAYTKVPELYVSKMQSYITCITKALR